MAEINLDAKVEDPRAAQARAELESSLATDRNSRSVSRARQKRAKQGNTAGHSELEPRCQPNPGKLTLNPRC
jgi:hypothetical protein